MKEVHTAQIENAEVICTKCGNPGSMMSDAELDAMFEAFFGSGDGEGK